MCDQTLTRNIEVLTLELTILRLVIAKMLAGILRTSEESDQTALWRFVDETQKAMDEGPEALTAIQAASEMTRTRFDAFMRAVQLELKREYERY